MPFLVLIVVVSGHVMTVWTHETQVIVIVNSTVTLSCTFENAADFRWEFYNVSTKQPINIYNGVRMNPINLTRHTVNNNSNSLSISNVELGDAGKYRCYRAGATNGSDTELVVLVSELNCSTDERPTDGVVRVRCEIIYQGNVEPTVECRLLPDNKYFNVINTSLTRPDSPRYFEANLTINAGDSSYGSMVNCTTNFTSIRQPATYVLYINNWTSTRTTHGDQQVEYVTTSAVSATSLLMTDDNTSSGDAQANGDADLIVVMGTICAFTFVVFLSTLVFILYHSKFKPQRCCVRCKIVKKSDAQQPDSNSSNTGQSRDMAMTDLRRRASGEATSVGQQTILSTGRLSVPTAADDDPGIQYAELAVSCRLPQRQATLQRDENAMTYASIDHCGAHHGF